MAATAAARSAQPPHEGGPVLAAFSRALHREAYVLRVHPQLTFQQLHNRLQWDDAAQQPVDHAREARSTPGSTPWLRTRTRFRESDALIRTLAGLNPSGYVGVLPDNPDGSS